LFVCLLLFLSSLSTKMVCQTSSFVWRSLGLVCVLLICITIIPQQTTCTSRSIVRPLPLVLFQSSLTSYLKQLSVPQRDTQEQWFNQSLTHFDHQDKRYWLQRYFINDDYYTGSGPLFLQMGGEAAISSAYVDSLDMTVYGETYGALLVALEHRFYGKSQPFDDLRTENLRYLSSQEALADAAVFVEWIGKKYQTSQVVTFGCSYPGNLAAWFRLRYPHLTVGAVASSAPVQAELDFYQYLDVVDKSLGYFTGPECEANIKNAVQQIDKLLATQDGLQQLSDIFQVCNETLVNGTDKDISTFMSSLIEYWMSTTQYNNDHGTGININTMCKIMADSTNPLSGFVEINALFLKMTRADCLSVAYEELVDVFKEIDLDDEESVGYRQWIYQTCTEFGYYQSTDSDNQPFGHDVPVSYWIDFCQDVFGLGLDTAFRINQTNIYYGGNSLPPTATQNILFVNGNIDPWHALSVVENISSTVEAILINETAHCANIIPYSKGDPQGIKDAQDRTEFLIGQWLSQTKQTKKKHLSGGMNH